tara:strand:+ start:1868 stop:2080 length:213 start_codon:yes stop_codon:yes gene_type:complete
MKITIESHGSIFVGELQKDCDIHEVTHAIKGLLVASGYHPVSVDEIYDPLMTDSWNISLTPPEEKYDDTE